MDDLVAAFLSRLPVEMSDVVGIADELTAVVSRARARAPDVDLDALAFVGYLAERVTFDAKGRPVLATVHAADLWIAYGCVMSDPAALAAFEVRFGGEIKSALRRSFELALAEDAELKLRSRLFLVDEHETSRLASYAGRGALAPWLRAAAIRTAVDLMRARRELPSDPAVLDLGAVDPLLASLKRQYRAEFQVAFKDAATQLTDRDRTLLRYRFVDDLSIDEIGVLHHVHRATVARWIAAIRETLFEGTRTRLMQRLTISDSEVDSVLRLIDSQLDVSLDAVIR